MRLSTEVAADRCLIRVADTGPGIPAEDIPHIFERFHSVDRAGSRSRAQDGSTSGAGLGLAIVKMLVEQNGGRIRVDSDPQQGATFLISFPLA